MEMTEFMVTMNQYLHGYAEALLVGAPKDLLLETEKPKSKERDGLSQESAARVTQEMQVLEGDFPI